MKQKRMPRPNRRRFIIGWLLVWLGSLFLPGILSALAVHFDFINVPPPVILDAISIGVLATLQIILVRRYLHTELHHWLLLALLGFIVGQIGLHFFQANVEYVFPPAVIPRLKEPESIAWLRFALYDTAYHFLHWSVPLVFQWLALRKRFRHHGLWLLAVVISAPYAFFASHGAGGIFGHAVDLLEHLTGLSMAQSLGGIALLLDWATPTMIMGFVLQYLVTKNKSSQLSA